MAGITAAALAHRGLAADPTETTAERLKTLRTCESITAAFRYFGDQDKPFYQVTYVFGERVKPVGENMFQRITSVDRDGIHSLLDALAKDGFIGAASDVSTRDLKPVPGYSLTLTAKKPGGAVEFKRLGWQAIKDNGHVELYLPLGWNMRMIERLEALQPALSGPAAKDMEFLLGRLSGLKREWQKAP